MHIVDGALSLPVVGAGAVFAIAGVALGLKTVDYDRLPQVAVLSAAFFVASLIHVPIGVSSVHLILNGLVGIGLGWAAFPAMLIALALQAAFFGFGGLVVLGVNTFNIALPAVLVYYLCRRGVRSERRSVALAFGAAAGAGAIVFTTILVAGSLALTGQEFVPAAKFTFVAHIPVMVVEGVVTAAAVVLLNQVKPDFFGPPSSVSHDA
jgi:cobalt/nickel transport system permease protein